MSNRRIHYVLVIFFLSALAPPMLASSEEFGYVYCSGGVDRSSFIPLFANPCIKQSFNVVNCGQKVRLLGRENQWLKLALPEGAVAYVGTASVSNESSRFIPFETLPPMKPPINLAECSAIRARYSLNQPAELLASAIDVSDKHTVLEADEAVDGVIVLFGRLGLDGHAQEVQVQLPKGNGLDEKAKSIVEKSRFSPALKNGQAVSSLLFFDVAVRYTCIGGTARSTVCTPFLFVQSLRTPH